MTTDFQAPAPAGSNAHRFPIGTQYLRHNGNGKRVDLCTVVDQLTLTNSRGEVLRRSYITSHPFCGQQVTEHDVGDTTIARGLTPEFAHLLRPRDVHHEAG